MTIVIYVSDDNQLLLMIFYMLTFSPLSQIPTDDCPFGKVIVPRP
jgi:hypothetical protein